MRNPALQQLLRQTVATQVVAARALQAEACVRARRPDYAFFAEQEAEGLREARHLAVRYRARPSLLGPLLGLVGGALGAVAAVAPPRVARAVQGAVADAVQEQHDASLRDLYEAGLAGLAPDVRSALRSMRDAMPQVEGAPKAPDLLQQAMDPRSLSPAEGIAGAVKLLTSQLLQAAGRF